MVRLSVLGAVALAACTGPTPGGGAGSGGSPPQPPGTGGIVSRGGAPGAGGEPGTGGSLGPVGTPVAPVPVTASLTPEQQQEVTRLEKIVAENKNMTADQLLDKRKLPWKAALGYDPAKAVNLPLIQASSLKLSPDELAALGRQGFVITNRHRFPHFAYGLKTIYADDLPVFISADAILQAVHESYSDILKAIETQSLLTEIEELLRAMQARLDGPSSPEMAADTRRDVLVFLTVARSLLRGAHVDAGLTEAVSLVDAALAAVGSAEIVLFGSKREIDFSQFTPRGHYADLPQLERYFRAMMWLGRIDLPLLQTDPKTGKQQLQRSSVAAALALRALMDDDARARWARIDATLRAFVGEPDSMGPPDVDRLKSDLALTGDSLGNVSDDQLAAAIVAGGYGKQRILSQIVRQDPHQGAWPLDATFLFLGQRYVFDAHVFQSVVYDRVNVAKPGVGKRMMPDPLDVAYAALGNDQAAALLGPDLRKHEYAPALETARRLGDEHGADFWDANLYNLWLGALRALSPGADLASSTSGLPAVAATEAWGRRLLSTQLASWAQLRHDTILYAKQSYTPGIACEFPDAYVDPYPSFFAALERFAATGAKVVETLTIAPPSGAMPGFFTKSRIVEYFQTLGRVTGILGRMAEHQRTGLPHAPEHLAFINRAVGAGPNYAGPEDITGWYADLFFEPRLAATFDPTIADVHTQPTDEAGNNVGRVLHVATGLPRAMVMTVETCMGPRAYAGVVSSYHEVVTENLQRLNDNQWKDKAMTAPEVPWMKPLVLP